MWKRKCLTKLKHDSTWFFRKLFMKMAHRAIFRNCFSGPWSKLRVELHQSTARRIANGPQSTARRGYQLFLRVPEGRRAQLPGAMIEVTSRVAPIDCSKDCQQAQIDCPEGVPAVFKSTRRPKAGGPNCPGPWSRSRVELPQLTARRIARKHLLTKQIYEIAVFLY